MRDVPTPTDSYSMCVHTDTQLAVIQLMCMRHACEHSQGGEGETSYGAASQLQPGGGEVARTTAGHLLHLNTPTT